MGRNTDILRGPELQKEYNKYIEYKEKDRAAKQAAYKALNVSRINYATQSAYIAPFLQPGKTLFVIADIPASGQPEPAPKALDFASTYFSIAAPTGTTNIILEAGPSTFSRSKLAKIIVKARGALIDENHQSRMTGRFYKRYQTNSVSMFLGKNAAADDYGKVVAEIKAKASYKTFVGAVGNTVQFIPEG